MKGKILSTAVAVFRDERVKVTAAENPKCSEVLALCVAVHTSLIA